jgi:hypothetical protein
MSFRSPVKYTWQDRRRPVERPSIIPVLLWVVVIVVAALVGWFS